MKRVFGILSLLLLSVVWVSAQGVMPDATLVANGDVLTQVTVGNTTYYGGNFTSIGKDTGHAAFVNSVSGNALENFPHVNGTVHKIVSDNNGGFVLGGNFSQVGNVSVTNLAHVRADFSVDETFRPQVGGEVRSLGFLWNTVYVGGGFTTVDGEPRTHLAAISLTQGLLSWAPVVSRDKNDGQPPQIISIGVSRHGVFVCGSFDEVNSLARRGFVHFGFDGLVSKFVVDEPDQYDTTGVFPGSYGDVRVGIRTRVNGSIFAGKIAKFNLKSGQKIWVTDFYTSPTSFEGYRGVLYANAMLQTQSDGGVQNQYAVALDDATGKLLPWNPKTNGVIKSLSVGYGGAMYVVGYFSRVEHTDRPFAAAVSTYDGTLLPWNPNANSYIESALFTGSGVVVGGYFGSVGAVKRNYFAAVNNLTGELADFNPGPDASVTLLLAEGNTVYAFGGFLRWAGVVHGGGVAFNAYSNQLTDFAPPRTYGTIWCGVVKDGKVFVGGDFQTFRDQTGFYYNRYYLAAFDGVNGLLDETFRPQADNIVYEMFLNGDLLRVRGYFTSINGVPRARDALISTEGVVQ